MRDSAPFMAEDLAELDYRLLAKASSVIAMQEVAAGNRSPTVLAMRHDVDDNPGSFPTAVKLAEWEAERGYRSTYYLLHSASYWGAAGFREGLETIAIYGHEIGIHTDALAASFVQDRDPDLILDEALAELRSYGFQVRGVAGHGNPLCNRDAGRDEPTFANDEQFVECARPQEGPPDRLLTRGTIQRRLAPRPLADFGLDYEALQLALPNPWRMSDSGGRWQHPNEPTFDEQVARFPDPSLQFHLLVHPDWWPRAFDRQLAEAAA